MQYCNTFDSFKHHIRAIVESQDEDETTLMIKMAFLLGASNVDEELENKVEALYNKRRGLRFFDKIITYAGAARLPAPIKEKLVASSNPGEIITRANTLMGKDEATLKLQPLFPHLDDLEFQQAFLEYEGLAHTTMLKYLSYRLNNTANRIKAQHDLIGLTSKKNTLQKLYTPSNIGKKFLSIDLKQANWQALRQYDNLPEWELLLREMLPSGLEVCRELIIGSKYFRQKILGLCCKNLGIQKLVEATQVRLIKQLSKRITNRIGNPEVFCESNDEIIIRWNDEWNKSLLQSTTNIRVTMITFNHQNKDGSYRVSYEEITTNSKTKVGIRCSNPDMLLALM